MLDYTGYPNTAVDANYTYNKAKDASGATALDGTPLLASFMNDVLGSWQALVKRGAVTPSGSSDTENSSDIADAIMKAISKRFTYNSTTTHSADTDAQVDILICDTSGGDITITLAAPPFNGKRFFIVATGGNTAFIAGPGLTNNIPVVAGVQLELNSDSSTLYPINHDKRICKAWVNFNGTGTVAIRDSFNVSSITDNGVGLYTINFKNDMNDENYTWSGSGRNNDTSAAVSFVISQNNAYTKSISQLQIRSTFSVSGTTALSDSPEVCIQIFGS